MREKGNSRFIIVEGRSNFVDKLYNHYNLKALLSDVLRTDDFATA